MVLSDCSFRPLLNKGSSCGSVVLATLLEIPTIHADSLMDINYKTGWNGYTNVGHIRSAVESKNLKMEKTNRLNGIKELPKGLIFKIPVAIFIQIEGPWEKKGWRSAYNYTHWALVFKKSVMDINNRQTELAKYPSWEKTEVWEGHTMKHLIENIEGATGWHIRSAYIFHPCDD